MLVVEKLIEQFQQCYRELSIGNLADFRLFYDEAIAFKGPFGTVNGLRPLQNTVAEWLSGIRLWDLSWDIVQMGKLVDRPLQASATLHWTLRVAHTSLEGGRTMSVSGHTYLEMDLEPAKERIVLQLNDYER